MIDNKWLNLMAYIIGSACTAGGLIDLAIISPYSKALTAFGAALLAVGQWGKLMTVTPVAAPAAPVTPPEAPKA